MLTLNFDPFPIIETERLILRKINKLDAEELFTLRKNIEVMRYLDRPVATTIDSIYELINKIETNYKNHEGIGWAIEIKNQNGLIGTIGYHRLEKEHFRAEIGYQLNPQYWNKGIMSEAIAKIINFGFEKINLHSVEAKVNPDNENSIRLLIKHNFCKEAYYRENYFYDGKFLDTAVYSLIRNKQ